mmetsp:Transcript_20233/g.63958  ORF Transcript_20233/g.63958 Transcript_20233/m.63958 type:complete len:330 (+) Transcript_20233:231-1220(+)
MRRASPSPASPHRAGSPLASPSPPCSRRSTYSGSAGTRGTATTLCMRLSSRVAAAASWSTSPLAPFSPSCTRAWRAFGPAPRRLSARAPGASSLRVPLCPSPSHGSPTSSITATMGANSTTSTTSPLCTRPWACSPSSPSSSSTRPPSTSSRWPRWTSPSSTSGRRGSSASAATRSSLARCCGPARTSCGWAHPSLRRPWRSSSRTTSSPLGTATAAWPTSTGWPLSTCATARASCPSPPLLTVARCFLATTGRSGCVCPTRSSLWAVSVPTSRTPTCRQGLPSSRTQGTSREGSWAERGSNCQLASCLAPGGGHHRRDHHDDVDGCIS